MSDTDKAENVYMPYKPTLYIIRGLPGSGKSTLANSLLIQDLVYAVWSADMYFETAYGYEFDASKLVDAHEWCYGKVAKYLANNESVAVANTFTTERELKPYVDLANRLKANLVSLIVENRHGNSSIHNVPDETLVKMKNRFSIKL